MFKKKKVPPVAAVKLPPKVVKETKNFRLVQIQQPLEYFLIENGSRTGNVVSRYGNQLVLEKRDIDCMEQPTWKFSSIVSHGVGNDNSWDLCLFVKEAFGERQ